MIRPDDPCDKMTIRLHLAAEMTKSPILLALCSPTGELTTSEIMDCAFLLADGLIERANRDDDQHHTGAALAARLKPVTSQAAIDALDRTRALIEDKGADSDEGSTDDK